MSAFPDTPTALLTRIAMRISGEDETVWSEFFELYTPAMRAYLVCRGTEEYEIDDIVQDVMAKLVSVLRSNVYDKEKSRFRTYLSRLLYNEMIDHYRRSLSRREHMRMPLDEDALAVPPAAGDAIDQEWALARHAAAVGHILDKTALSDLSKRVYRELEKSGDTCESVAKRIGIKAATVRQIKSRVGRMVAELERRLGG